MRIYHLRTFRWVNQAGNCTTSVPTRYSELHHMIDYRSIKYQAIILKTLSCPMREAILSELAYTQWLICLKRAESVLWRDVTRRRRSHILYCTRRANSYSLLSYNRAHDTQIYSSAVAQYNDRLLVLVSIFYVWTIITVITLRLYQFHSQHCREELEHSQRSHFVLIVVWCMRSNEALHTDCDSLWSWYYIDCIWWRSAMQRRVYDAYRIQRCEQVIYSLSG